MQFQTIILRSNTTLIGPVNLISWDHANELIRSDIGKQRKPEKKEKS